MTEGQEFAVSSNLTIEQNVGLYGGPYRPMVGGRPSSGFTSVGAFTYSYSPLPDGCRVGRYCSISTGLRFIDSSHPLDLITTSAITFRPKNDLFKDFLTDGLVAHAAGYRTTNKVYPTIGNDVWIGSNVTLAMGIELGTGSVVATNSTVTKDVPPYAIVGGNPAKVIKMRFDGPAIDRLLSSQWWNYDPRQVLQDLHEPMDSPLKKIETGRIDPFTFVSVRLSELA
ncbi:CatB-related O-acetyltransferase [Arthrobacter sp. OVS8]|nr:CatB-related O-acetyltransferase [Arthrobacter sp. OVS8]